MKERDAPLTIEPELRARLMDLAARSGTSLAELVESVLCAHADEQERILDELSEDEERWQRYLADGQNVSFQVVREKLHGLAGEAARKTQTR